MLRGREDKTRDEKVGGNMLCQCKTNRRGRTSHRLAQHCPGVHCPLLHPHKKDAFPPSGTVVGRNIGLYIGDCILLCCKLQMDRGKSCCVRLSQDGIRKHGFLAQRETRTLGEGPEGPFRC